MFTTTKMTLADYMIKSKAIKNVEMPKYKGSFRQRILKGSMEKAPTYNAIHKRSRSMSQIKITNVMIGSEETQAMGLAFVLAKDQRKFLRQIKPKKSHQSIWVQVAYIEKCIREYLKTYNNKIYD